MPEPVGGDGAYIGHENERLQLEIDAETGRSISAGEPMNLGLAVDALLAYAPP